MKSFNIFYQTEEQYNDICDQLHRFGYNTQGLETFNGDIRQCFFLIMDHDFIRIQRGSVIIDSPIFAWSTQRKEAIKFMKENSPIGIQIKKNKEYEIEQATKFWQKVLSPDPSHIQQIEQRIHELEIKQITDLDDVNKRMRTIDKKLRSRMHDIDLIIENLNDRLNKDSVKIDKMDKWIADKIKLDKSIKDYDKGKFGGIGTNIGFAGNFIKDHKENKCNWPGRTLDGVWIDEVNSVPDLSNLKTKGDQGKVIASEETKPKIAIRVENEEEFNELMDIYESRGWKHKLGVNPLNIHLDEPMNCTYEFNDNFLMQSLEPKHIEIIPFQTLKAILS